MTEQVQDQAAPVAKKPRKQRADKGKPRGPRKPKASVENV